MGFGGRIHCELSSLLLYYGGQKWRPVSRDSIAAITTFKAPPFVLLVVPLLEGALPMNVAHAACLSARPRRPPIPPLRR